MPVSRSLDITVTFHGTYDAANNSYGGTATYVQTGSTPAMGQIVDSDGSIHLDRAPDAPDGYSQNVDINLTLATPCLISPSGDSVPVVWASVYGPPAVIEVPEGGSSSEIAVVRAVNRSDLITLQDNDDDSNVYSYKPFVELPTIGNYRIGLDPTIVNRPKTTNK